jgi:signal transduction histidine kinase
LNTGFSLPTERVVIPDFVFTIIPVVILLTFQFALLAVMKYGLSNPIRLLYNVFLNRKLKEEKENIRDILHSRKNILFSIRILSEKIRNNYGSESGQAALKDMQTLCDSNIDSVSRTLNALRDVHPKIEKDNFIDIIENAIDKIVIPEQIRILRRYFTNYVLVKMDYYHISNMIMNILENSIDAIIQSGKPDGNIVIKVEKDGAWIRLSIIDNGKGIPRKMLRKVHKPFFSDKSRQKNWGVGLSYVKKVIKMHMGYFWLESKENQFTSFNILFPDFFNMN